MVPHNPEQIVPFTDAGHSGRTPKPAAAENSIVARLPEVDKISAYQALASIFILSDPRPLRYSESYSQLP